MTEYDDYAQNQRDMLRATSMGRRITAAPIERDWPHVPRPVCDRCDRDAEPGSALCVGCADRQYFYDRDAAEEKEGG